LKVVGAGLDNSARIEAVCRELTEICSEQLHSDGSLINGLTILTMDLLTTQHLVSGADIGIASGFILEVLAPEQTAIALVDFFAVNAP
jgi:hypothetical protein